MTANASKVGEYHPWTTYVYAREEARRRGDRRVGTEHLVLGLLREPDLAQVLGCDLGAAREALDAMDRDALVAVGIDRALGAPPVQTREPALGGGRPSLKAVLADRLPMTPVAKRVLEESGRDRRRGLTERRWSPHAVLAALLCLAAPDPGAALLDALDVDRAAVGARLSKAISGTRHVTVDEAQGASSRSAPADTGPRRLRGGLPHSRRVSHLAGPVSPLRTSAQCLRSARAAARGWLIVASLS